jgi:hypothetical protein
VICLDCYYRTPNPDTYLMLKSPQGKALKKDLVQAREMGESVVTLIAGGYVPSTHEHSLEHNSTDLSSAARCQPYTTYDKGAKFKRRGDAIAYRATGISWNTVENINSLRDIPVLDPKKEKVFSNEERLAFLQVLCILLDFFSETCHVETILNRSLVIKFTSLM